MSLLDSHTFVWLADGDKRLGTEARRLIREAFREDALYLSPISLWEISLKASRGKVIFDRPIRPWMNDAIRLTRVRLAPITADVAIDCSELPADFHGDPADRIIASTARVHSLLLLTEDRELLELARKGHFRAQRI
jgi:PIN domain nuclease of toxin-antitoxin system